MGDVAVILVYTKLVIVAAELLPSTLTVTVQY